MQPAPTENAPMSATAKTTGARKGLVAVVVFPLMVHVRYRETVAIVLEK